MSEYTWEFSKLFWALISIGGVLGLFALIFSVFIVPQQHVALVTRFGKFRRVATAGLNFKAPFIDWAVGNFMDLRIQQLAVKVETKTLDNVFIQVLVSVQYYVVPEKVYEAFYKLSDATEQISSYIFDVVRSKVPAIKLDDVFSKKDEIADAVRQELSETMDDFGYGITKALVTDIDPDSKVKAAMNEINAAQRLREAAAEKGEADKILKVKAAEAESLSKELQGKGIANQRKAIIEGLGDSIDQFQQAVKGTEAQDVMNLVLMTQYFDTLKDIGMSSKNSTILIPHSPGHLSDLTAQLRDAMIVAGQVKREE